jgi:ParB/RepB/Spo0J family partition protein
MNKTNETKPNGATEEIVQRVPLNLVHISEVNTRHPKPAEVSELTQSIKEFGQTTPALGRPHPKKEGHIELAAGARRRVAAEAAGLTTLGVIVRQMDDATLEETILVENLQREDPDPKAEVKLLDRLVRRGVQTASAISAHLGKPEHWVTRRLKLLDIIPELRKEWERNDERNDGRNGLGIQDYSVEMMSMLGALPKATQESFLGRDQYKHFENHELGDIETAAELKKYLDQDVSCLLAAAPFDLKDPKFFVKGCGPGCASDSTKQAGLFDFGQTQKDARCLNCSCFFARVAKWRKSKIDELKKANGITKDARLIVDATYCDVNRILVGSQEYQLHDRDYNEKILSKPPPKGDSEQVIVVDKRGEKFHVGYVVKERGYGSSTSQPKPKKKSLDTRKQILQSRRWDIVRKSLIDLVLASSAKSVTVDVVDLVPIFGFGFNCAPIRTEKHDNKLWAVSYNI